MPQIEDGTADRVGEVRALALEGDERNAVHEQDDVEDRYFTGPAADTELVDDGELVAVGKLLVPLDVLDDGGRPAVRGGRPGQQVAVEEEVGGGEVGPVDALTEGDGRQGGDRPLDVVRVHPRPAVAGAEVDTPQRPGKLVGQERDAGIERADVLAGDVLPAHRLKLRDGRPLHLVPLDLQSRHSPTPLARSRHRAGDPFCVMARDW